MELKRTANSELTISGHIKKTENYFELKDTINQMIQEGITEMHIKIPESLTITSSIIGLFLRIVSEDQIKINMYVGQGQLFDLLDSLNMLKVFNVQKI